MDSSQRALLDVIRAFKTEGISDLEAALNVIRNHAMTIKALHNQLDAAREEIDKVSKVLAELGAEMAPRPKDA